MAPVKLMLLMYKTSVPVFTAEKVRLELVPKSVLLAVLVETPIGILLPLALTARETEGAVVTV